MLLGAAAVFVALSAGDGRGVPASASAAGKPVKMSIKDFMFTKPNLVVTKGTKITWTNRDEVNHTVTANKPGGPSSPLIKPGDSYTWVASKKGTLKYHCSPHHFMKSTITVK